MKRLFIVLVASLVLGLVGGVGTAMAGDLLTPPPETVTPSQTATQSNDGSNTANQTGTSEPVVISGANVAIANGSSCNPCGGSGTTNQNSGNAVDASNTNSATQTNTQSNGAGQTQTASQGSEATQSVDQSNHGENTADQSGTSEPVVVSGPNVAVLNSGDVNQNSGNHVDASNTNTANQSNNQSNGAGQSQTVAGNGCCSSDGASQPASQSNEGSNSADQRGYSAPIVVSGGNYAIANKGDVNQNSGNWVDASNHNTANQSNTQSNGAGQSQTVAGSNGCCHTGDVSQSADQSNSGSNTANQSGYSAPIVVSGPNIAVANGWVHDACDPCAPAGGDVNQNSGNWVDASNHNTATQSNNQSNGLAQNQRVTGSGCCGSGDVSQSASQSNWAENKADQCASSAPVVVSGKNVAFLNGGDVNQNSGNWVDASNHNRATQSNTQSNGLGQVQRVSGGSSCCGGTVEQTASQCNSASNEANQTGRSTPFVASGDNLAAFNGGNTRQNSGNWVDASNHNTATQSNNQSNRLGQTQRVDRGGCCESSCEPRCDNRCEPEPCEPKREPKRCEPKCGERCEPRCEPKPCEEKTQTRTRGRG
jgi:hypothetical protein